MHNATAKIAGRELESSSDYSITQSIALCSRGLAAKTKTSRPAAATTPLDHRIDGECRVEEAVSARNDDSA